MVGGGAMVLGKLSVRGILLIWIIVGQEQTALAVGAGGVDGHFFLVYHFSLCLKRPLNPKQSTWFCG